MRDDSSDQKRWDEILVENDNFVCTPTLGALVEGYILTIPKNHVICAGGLPLDILDDYWDFTSKMSRIIEEIYGKSVIFEHGPSQSNTQVGCGVDHAHLHIVPFQESLFDNVNQINPSPISWQHIDDIIEIKRTHESGKEYLLFQNQTGELMLGTSSTISSQLFRRAIAKSRGHPEKFDWKSYSFKKNVEATVNTIKNKVQDKK